MFSKFFIERPRFAIVISLVITLAGLISLQNLPMEEKANAARMLNITPKLQNDTTFEVGVDNEMVEKNMKQLLPSIQNFLRERLHNRKISMSVRILKAQEVVKAYSQVERFQLMSKKNPKLLKLKEIFDLELN